MAKKTAAAQATKHADAGPMGRKFLLDVKADGAVLIRERGLAPRLGLPVFSCDTYEEADMLRVRHCRLMYDNTTYRLNEFGGRVEDLAGVTELFAATFSRRQARELTTPVARPVGSVVRRRRSA